MTSSGILNAVGVGMDGSILPLFCSLFYYCKSLLPTIGGLDPRVPPGSVLLYPTGKPALRAVCMILYRIYNVGHQSTRHGQTAAECCTD